MTTDERTRVEAAFLDAQQAPPTLRDDVLRRAFPGEPGLLREARLLLAAGEEGEAYFADLARRAGAAHPDPTDPAS